MSGKGGGRVQVRKQDKQKISKGSMYSSAGLGWKKFLGKRWERKLKSKKNKISKRSTLRTYLKGEGERRG